MHSLGSDTVCVEHVRMDFVVFFFFKRITLFVHHRQAYILTIEHIAFGLSMCFSIILFRWIRNELTLTLMHQHRH